MLLGHTTFLQKISRLQIDRDLEIYKLNPLTHGFSDEHVHWISELDHWGKFEAEMLKAGEDIREIRNYGRVMELNEYAQNLNTTMSGAEDMTGLFNFNDLSDDIKDYINKAKGTSKDLMK